MPNYGPVPAVTPPEIGTDAQLDRYMSVYGVRMWTNHTLTDDAGEPGENLTADESENAFVLWDCKCYAGAFLAGKLAGKYTYEQLQDAPVMAEIWCVVVLRTLCFRRGTSPPASLEFRYQEIVQRDGLIDQLINGKMVLVDTTGEPIRLRNSAVPTWSNLHVDRIYPESKVRVITGSSDMSTSQLPRKTDRFPEAF